MRNVIQNSRMVSAAGIAALCCFAGCGGSSTETTPEPAPAPPASVSGSLANAAAEKVVEHALSESHEDVKVNIDGDNISFSGKSGETGQMDINFGGTAAVPEGFPKDVPLPKDLTVQMSMKLEQQEGFQIQATCPQNFETVAAFFQKEVAAQGWTEKSNMSQAGVLVMGQYEKDGRELHVQVTNAGTECHIMVMTAKAGS
jgi:hypothetical protein